MERTGVPAGDGRSRLQRHLLAGEQIIWTGQPNPKKHFTRADIFLVPFSLLLGGFALFWNVLVWSWKAPLLFKIWGVPFLLGGLYLIVGRFFLQAHVKKKTLYALTDRRILILAGKKDLIAQNIRDIRGESVHVGKSGNGTITFGFKNSAFRQSLNMMQLPDSWGVPRVPEFAQIDHCQEVYRRYQTIKGSGGPS